MKCKRRKSLPTGAVEPRREFLVKMTVRTVRQTKALARVDFVESLVEELSARFSQWVVTPRRTEAWQLGLGWLWDGCAAMPTDSDDWLLMPEYAPPLSAVRPDLLVITGSHVLVVEMKTGHRKVAKAAYRRADHYVANVEHRLRTARETDLVPVLLTLHESTSVSATLPLWSSIHGECLELGPIGFANLLNELGSRTSPSVNNVEAWTQPAHDLHPSIVEAATA